MVFIGKRTQVCYGEETSYGVVPTTTNTWIGKVQSFTPTDEADWLDVNVADGANSRNITQRHSLITKYGGSLVYYIQDGRFLKYAFGGVTTTGTGPYTHQITEENTLPSFSLEEAKIGNTGNEAKLYSGCKINTLTLKWEKSNPVEIETEIVAQTLDTNYAKSNLAIYDVSPYMGYMTRLFYDPTGSNERLGELNSGEFKIDNTLYIPEYSNDDLGRRIGEPIPNLRQYEATFNINQKDDTWTQRWKQMAEDEVTAEFRLEFYRGTDDYIRINMYDCVIVSTQSATDVEKEVIDQPIIIKPRYVEVSVVDNISVY